jgi:hypothetical protein
MKTDFLCHLRNWGRLCKEEASAAWKRDLLSACPKGLPVFLAYQPPGWSKLQCTNLKIAAIEPRSALKDETGTTYLI